MTTRHRRFADRDHEAYEMMGERNPAYIGPRDGMSDDDEDGMRRGVSCREVLSWLTFALTIVAAVFSVVAMSFSVMNNNSIGDIKAHTSLIAGETATDAARFFRDDIFIKATHGRTYYETDVPSLKTLELVSTYVQQVLYPKNTELKIQKSVYAYDTDDAWKPLNNDPLCTYTHYAEPSSDEFERFTIPTDAAFIVDGSDPPLPCTYNWPPESGKNGSATNYVVFIKAMVDGSVMSPSQDTLNGAAEYSSNLVYHIVNERVTLVKTDPTSSTDITSDGFMKKFVPFQRVYGYGKVDFSYTINGGTPISSTIVSYNAKGVPLKLPQAVFVALCNAANTANAATSAVTNAIADTSPLKLAIKVSAVNGIYPTNPDTVTMTFKLAEEANIPNVMFPTTFPSKTSLLMVDVLAPIKTSSTPVKAPVNPFVSGYGTTINIYPFGKTYDHVKISSANPAIEAGTSPSTNPMYGSTLPTSSITMEVGSYSFSFDGVTIVPEFSTPSTVTATGLTLSTSNLFSTFIKLNPDADAMIKSQGRTVIFTVAIGNTVVATAAKQMYEYINGLAANTVVSAVDGKLTSYISGKYSANSPELAAVNAIKSALNPATPLSDLATLKSTALTEANKYSVKAYYIPYGPSQAATTTIATILPSTSYGTDKVWGISSTLDTSIPALYSTIAGYSATIPTLTSGTSVTVSMTDLGVVVTSTSDQTITKYGTVSSSTISIA